MTILPLGFLSQWRMAGPASETTSKARRTLAATGINHALHDGYTDLIYVLLPVWQTEFALSYGLWR